MAVKKRWYRNWFIRKFIRISYMIGRLFGAIRDKRICGVSLENYVPTLRPGESTGSQSTNYGVLDKMFSGSEFTDNDSYIDVGCGRGRTLCYLLGKKTPMKLTGIEYNKDVADFTKKWAENFKELNIINDDAFNLDYNDYTVMFMGRPFLPDTFYKFVSYLEQTLTHPIKLFYWVDQQSGDYLNDRKGWTMLKREKVFFCKGFFVAPYPQRFSVWVFDPNEAEKSDE